MSPKTPTPKTAGPTAYDAAVARLTEADERCRSAQSRIADLDAKIADLDAAATRLEAERGRAFANGDLETAASTGKGFSENRLARSDAVIEGKALRASMDELWIAVLEAEEAAGNAHIALFNSIHDTERPALVSHLQMAAARLWRAHYAAGNHISFRDWWANLGNDVDLGYDAILAADVRLPVPEIIPRSSLLPGLPRRGDSRRYEIRNLIELRDAARTADMARQAA
jgi:hypothetical protein